MTKAHNTRDDPSCLEALVECLEITQGSAAKETLADRAVHLLPTG